MAAFIVDVGVHGYGCRVTDARPRPVVLAAIAVGGVVGATARYALSEAVPVPDNGFPTATLVTNIFGSFLLGLFAGVSADVSARMHHLRPFFAVGVIGSFTTFSTFAVENVVLVDRGDVLVAMLYVVATLVAGLGAARLGIDVVRRFDRSAKRE